MSTITTRDYLMIAKHLANREGFRTHGSLAGYVPGAGVSNYLGRLPADWHRTLTARQHVVDYMVWSYNTPIAWHDREAGWIVPDEHYSVTTTRHQGRIRAALAFNGELYAS